MRNIIVKDSNRFKSIFVTVNLLMPLEANKTGKNALLAMMLKKSNELYQTEKELERALAELYNTTIDVGVEKLGDLYNIQISMEFLNSEFLNADEVDKIQEILYAIICRPNIKNNEFNKEIFEREKQALIQKIREERDDKKKYALDCLVQDMFKDSDYGTPTLGRIEDVEKITNNELAQYYNYVINTAEVVVCAAGNLKNMASFPEEVLSKICGKCGKHHIKTVAHEENDFGTINERIEKQAINQSVLCIGLKVNDINKEDVYALTLYNAILGGTPASKLFQNVREKESLAYYSKSVYNRLKQIIYMFSGVDPINNEKAKKVMLKQLEILKNGEISQEEFFAAKQSLISAYKELSDSKAAISRNMLTNELYFGCDVDFDEMIKGIDSLTLEDIIRVANKVVPTNIFLLGGEPRV